MAQGARYAQPDTRQKNGHSPASTIPESGRRAALVAYIAAIKSVAAHCAVVVTSTVERDVARRGRRGERVRGQRRANEHDDELESHYAMLWGRPQQPKKSCPRPERQFVLEPEQQSRAWLQGLAAKKHLACAEALIITSLLL